MAAHLETSDQLLRETRSAVTGAAREASVTLLAESIGSGVTANDVRELRRQTQAADRPAVSGEAIASAAKGLSFIREAKLPVSDGTGVIAEAVRQGFRSHEVLDLGREIKRRERDFIAGRCDPASPCATRSREASVPSSSSVAAAPRPPSGRRRRDPRRPNARNARRGRSDQSGRRRAAGKTRAAGTTGAAAVTQDSKRKTQTTTAHALSR